MIHFFRRNRAIFLMSLVAAAFLALLFLYSQPGGFVGMVWLVVPDETAARRLGLGTPASVLSPAQGEVSLFNELKQIPSFRQTVLQNASLARRLNPPSPGRAARFEASVKSAEARAETDRLVTIRAQGDTAADCLRLLTALRDEFVAERKRERAVAPVSLLQFHDREVEKFRQHLQRWDTLPASAKVNAARRREQERERADFRAMLEFRDALRLKSKARDRASEAYYRNASEPLVVPLLGAGKRVGIVAAALLAGLLLGAVLAGAREANRRPGGTRAGPV